MREGKKAARMLYLVTAGLKENPKDPAGGGGGGVTYITIFVLTQGKDANGLNIQHKHGSWHSDKPVEVQFIMSLILVSYNS